MQVYPDPTCVQTPAPHGLMPSTHGSAPRSGQVSSSTAAAAAAKGATPLHENCRPKHPGKRNSNTKFLLPCCRLCSLVTQLSLHHELQCNGQQSQLHNASTPADVLCMQDARTLCFWCGSHSPCLDEQAWCLVTAQAMLQTAMKCTQAG